MKAVIAIDSFKGSLTSTEAGKAASEGIKRVFPDAEVTVKPLADGGEGTCSALVSGLGGTYRKIIVTDPIGRKISAEYGILSDRTAVIEMAAASGITLIQNSERDPMHTTTYGTGELIRDAIENGCRRFIIGIGGSATNDGGIGCLQALGFDMLDKNGHQVKYGAEGVSELAEISSDNVMPELAECEFFAACDVNNPLCGENGCSAVFAPQKGADKKMISEMDRYLRKYAEIAKTYNPDADADTAGAGAAGGMGFALMYFLGAELESGINLVMRETGIENDIRNADIVITGEGCLDAQTAMGKAPVGIAQTAKKYGKPVIAFCGSVGNGAQLCNSHGIDAFFPVLRSVTTLSEAMDKENAEKNLADTVEQVFRLIQGAK
ncbi:MAG: glycerate kinase [Ruminococcus sp.]|nr:glycerate kinase [Ruminococcus sp.]